MVSLVSTAQTAIANDWTAYNRSVSFSAGHRQQNYVEIDSQGLTTDGVLNREFGQQTSHQAALRWQWHNGVTAQVSTARDNGATNYQGYLQNSNGTLTDFIGRTGNILTEHTVQVGYGFNHTNTPVLPKHIQITPLLQRTQHNWRRYLAQYAEKYDYTSTTAGLRVQHHIKEHTVLEAQALFGRTQSAKISVPNFNFVATQKQGNFKQYRVAISHDISHYFPQPTNHRWLKGWRVTAAYTKNYYNHGASGIVNVLQAPPNENRPSQWLLGLSKQF